MLEKGFIHAQGRRIVDGEGKEILLRGTNIGDWFVQEFWMASSCIGDFYKTDYTQKRGLEAMRRNPNLYEEQFYDLNQVYIDNFIKEEDFKRLSDLKINCVRINFTCYNITKDGYEIEERFLEKLDWAISMCEKYHLYCILDNHGAIGSQNQDNHSGNNDTFNLYGNQKNMDATVLVWETLARRYQNRHIIVGYDLLNETRKAPGKFSSKAQFDFYDTLYQAIRRIDKNHMILMECFTFPTHGVHPKKYRWENVAYSYHIYNLTPFPFKFGLYFYSFLDKGKRYDVPIIIGEFSCWLKQKDWYKAFRYFEKKHWSYLSWTYKTNNYVFTRTSFMKKKMKLWGMMEFSLEPVNLSQCTTEEMISTYQKVGSENAKPTIIYDAFYHHFVLKDK
ncbi:MAG: cellulase family glycosylhydrolase [Bacilli bacterium]|nr:cellulase family glycosylhydrolase [Bacilli bacterium]